MFVAAPHIGPFAHDIVPDWHGLPAGVHCEFAMQAEHVPSASHTPAAPLVVRQDVPAFAGVFWSVHVSTPPAHDVTLPMSHWLLAGAHAFPTWHALHIPLEQYSPLPQGEPSGAFIATLHTGSPVLQSSVFFTQGAAGSEQSLPAAHVPQLPPWHTAPGPEPHCAPSGTFAIGWHTRLPFTHA